MLKYVIWGAGFRGKSFLQHIGNDRIVAFVEEDKSRLGTTFCDVQIISKECYLQEYSMYPIVITPLNYEKEIAKWLYENGTSFYFDYWNECLFAEPFVSQVDYTNLFQKYAFDKDIVIYGWSMLSIEIITIFKKYEKNVSLCIPSSVNESIKKKIKKYIDIPIIEESKSIENKIVILATTCNEDFDKNNIVYDFTKITCFEDLFYYKEILKFKNKHHKKRCFIVACGPSLTMGDLDVLDKHGEICISMNKIFKAYEFTTWRPDYYIAIDPEPIKNENIDISSISKEAQFIGDSAWGCDKDQYDNVYKWHEYHVWNDGISPQFSGDFAKGVYWGMTITYAALQLAAYMGFSEIYLIGVDCCAYKEIEKQHFVPGYNKFHSNVRVEESILSYSSAEKYSREHGFRIFNATRGGALEVFERVDFDSLFDENKE